MSGKDLIIYILQNNLEDEEIIAFKDGVPLGYITREEVATKFDVGVSTVAMWYQLGMLKGTWIGDSIFFSEDVTDPRKE